MAKSKPISEEIKNRILELYPNERAQDIADMLGISVSKVYKVANYAGVKKSESFLSSEKSGRLHPEGVRGLNTRFKKGQQPWNKGISTPITEGMRKTFFKPGNKPHNTKNIGDEWTNTDGYVVVKLGEKNIQFKHRVIWEEANGPIPKGMSVVFKDKNKQNVQLSNLELVDRTELMHRNSIMNYHPELRPIIKTIAKLKTKINEKQDGRSKKSSLRSA
jgi:hypothetical protein